MEVRTVQDAKKLMENSIYLAVAAALERFQVDTGLSPARIDIQLLDVTKVGDREPKRIVSNVVADIKL